MQKVMNIRHLILQENIENEEDTSEDTTKNSTENTTEKTTESTTEKTTEAAKPNTENKTNKNDSNAMTGDDALGLALIIMLISLVGELVTEISKRRKNL